MHHLDGNGTSVFFDLLTSYKACIAVHIAGTSLRLSALVTIINSDHILKLSWIRPSALLVMDLSSLVRMLLQRDPSWFLSTMKTRYSRGHSFFSSKFHFVWKLFNLDQSPRFAQNNGHIRSSCRWGELRRVYPEELEALRIE